MLSQILLSGTTIFFIIESLYLRKNINSIKNKKKYINLNKKNIYKYIYENLKIKKWDELKYTKHIFYIKKSIEFFKFNAFFKKIYIYKPLRPHTTSEREKVKITIKAAQAILIISIEKSFLFLIN